ncbi:MAG: hypothetical protein RIG62_05460 [Cyclobacteriaceae bacterium]
MKRIFIPILTVIAAALPILFRYLIYSTETLPTFEAFLLSDWMFFCITINAAIANVLGTKATLTKTLSWALTSSSLLIGISGFVLGLSMFIPEVFAEANMQALNTTGIVLVILTGILYIVVLFTSNQESYD